jgi:hypothetical protein
VFASKGNYLIIDIYDPQILSVSIALIDVAPTGIVFDRVWFVSHTSHPLMAIALL